MSGVSVTAPPPPGESCRVLLVLPVAAAAEHGICCQFGVLETANVTLLCLGQLETCNLYALEITNEKNANQ